MLRSTLTTLALLLLIGGCAASSPTVGAVGRWTEAERPVANLTLGASADQTYVATLQTGRAMWPAVENGYRLDGATHYYQIRYDYETSYGRHGGLHNSSQSIERGVWVR